jgi:hypothetical protein
MIRLLAGWELPGNNAKTETGFCGAMTSGRPLGESWGSKKLAEKTKVWRETWLKDRNEE